MLHYRLVPLLAALFLVSRSHAQELFVYSEPASNMPAKSIGIRATNLLMPAVYKDNYKNYYLQPEVMWGLNKHLMLHLDGYFSNAGGSFAGEGFGVYAKYRFFSRDKVYRHFRMAAFARAAVNYSQIQDEELSTGMKTTGYQAGFIGTQLLHKTALSATAYFERAFDNGGGNEQPKFQGNNAINYTLSVGHLMLPRKYSSYKQTNFNLMLEFPGQYQTTNQQNYLDVAPSLQLIFNSQTRVDIGYRRSLHGNMYRVSPNGFLIRIEHLFYRVI